VRVSPVFDAARTLLVVEIDGDTLTSLCYLAFDPSRSVEWLRILQDHSVQLLICGAVSEDTTFLLKNSGIAVFSFIAGEVPQLLEHLLQGLPIDDEFRQPGCGTNHQCTLHRKR
jgi:predicted Fe-Mo cluster-binding NifX family protein